MGSDLTPVAVSGEDPIHRWLTWAIRLSIFLLVATLIVLGFYFSRHRPTPASPSSTDRIIQNLESDIRAHPSDPLLRATIASLYVEKGRHEDAVAQAEQVLRVIPGHLGALLVLGRAYAEKGELDRAVDYLSLAVELNQDDPMAKASPQLGLIRQYLGRLYLDQGQTEKAIAEFRQVLEINRADADSLYLLGRALAAQQQTDQAIETYLKALRLVPDFPEVYGDLVRAYHQKGDPGRALFAWGMVSYSLADYDQALESLQEAARAVPQMQEVHLGLGMVYEKKGQRDLALDEYRKVLSIDATSIAARQAVGRLGGKP